MQAEFLKICVEFDRSDDLRIFCKGFLLILKEIRITEAINKAKIPRATIYQMLWKDTNPNLRYLITILDYLGQSFWMVCHEVIYSDPSNHFKYESRPVELTKHTI